MNGHTKGRLLASLAVALVAGCASVPDYEDDPSRAEKIARYEARAEALQAHERWALDGRLAVSDGEDGGSGKLEWRHRPGLSELDFRGALGRGAWQLDIQPGYAVLNLASGETWEARNVATLVRKHVGWDVPVDALGWWVRGLAAPGRIARRDLDEAGRMTRLSQQGWEVEYKRYEEFSGLALPTRLEARKGERHVKFAMRDWRFSESVSPAASGDDGS